MLTVIMVYDQAYVSGGAAKIAIGEAIELKNRGYRVIYYSAVSDLYGKICDELVNNKIETICLGETHIAFTKDPKALLKGIWNKNSFKKFTSLLNSLDRNNTIVHIHGWTKALSSSVIEAAHKMGFKTVITLHEYFSVCQNGGLFDYKKNCICKRRTGSLSCYLCNCDKHNYIHKIYRNIRQLRQNRILKKSKPNVIYITDFSKEKLSVGKNLIGNSYSLTNFVELSPQQRVRVEDNEAYLFIGRISAEKGIDVFCEAIKQAGVDGVVIGEGPLKNKYKELYPEVTFVGWKSNEEMRLYLNKARALIIASKWYETMGLTVVEMQQYGIPCIVPSECAASEYVRNEVDGLLYEIGSIDSLIQCISKIQIQSYVKLLSKKFYEAIEFDRFSIKCHIDKLLIIYNDILNRDL